MKFRNNNKIAKIKNNIKKIKVQKLNIKFNK